MRFSRYIHSGPVVSHRGGMFWAAFGGVGRGSRRMIKVKTQRTGTG